MSKKEKLSEKSSKEPDFIKQYNVDVAAMFGLPKICRNVLDLIVPIMDCDNIVALFAPMKKDMAKILDLKTQSVEKAILKLNKAEIITRIDRGMYRVNPYLYGKGEWKDINKLRLTTNYSKKGIKVSGEKITEEQAQRTKKNKINHEEKSYIDHQTGEIIQEQKITKTKVPRQEFMQVFLNDISGLLAIESKTQLKILVELWKLAKFDTNQIIIIKGVKQMIADNIGAKYKTVDNHISKMYKSGLLIRKETSIYYLNPKYFFKGYLENRPSILKLVLEYQVDTDEDNL